jgi:hypothetical protein
MCHSSCRHASPLSLGTPILVEVEVFDDAAEIDVDDGVDDDDRFPIGAS